MLKIAQQTALQIALQILPLIARQNALQIASETALKIALNIVFAEQAYEHNLLGIWNTSMLGELSELFRELGELCRELGELFSELSKRIECHDVQNRHRLPCPWRIAWCPLPSKRSLAAAPRTRPLSSESSAPPVVDNR